MRTNLPVALRWLRVHHRLRQQDLGAKAGLSRSVVSRAERGALDGITVGSLTKLAEALGASLHVEIRWRGAELDRLVDRQHAHVQEAAARRLAACGWSVHVEVSFSHYGDRGSCDLVAWHGATRTLLIVEVKSRLGNLQELLHRLDVKTRLGSVLARGLGLPGPRVVARALVISEDRPSRRVLERHPAIFSGLGTRGRAAHAWIGESFGPASAAFSGSRNRQIHLGRALQRRNGSDRGLMSAQRRK